MPAKPIQQTGKSGRVDVLCSFFPMYLFTKNVVGDRENVDVSLMVPAQMGCPHDYDLSPEDVKRLARADVFVMNGAGLEEFSLQQVKAVNPDILVVDASEGIDAIGHDGDAHHRNDADNHHDVDRGKAEHKHEKDEHEHDDHAKVEATQDAQKKQTAQEDDRHDHESKEHHQKDDGHDRDVHDHHHHGDVNPHFFSSPRQAVEQVRRIAEGLAKADPKGEETYRENAAEYATRLSKLSEEFERRLASVENPRIVTMHEVFDYLARDYGLEIVATIHSAPGYEPSAGEMRRLIEKIKKAQAAAVFTEPQYSERVAEVVAHEAGIPVYRLDPVASGPEDAPLDYYETTMRKNLETLGKALGSP